MQTARLLRPRRILLEVRRVNLQALISTVPSSSNSQVPWFVDRIEDTTARPEPPHLSPQVNGDIKAQTAPFPPDLPKHLVKLHDELCKSPHLEIGGVDIRPPPPTQPGPPLPPAIPKGRRKRGRTDFGLGVPEPEGGLWRWIVVAQVKEGTENRGAIESVLRIVRRTLLTAEPPLPLPPNRKRRVQDGWGMLDAGEFAVHVLSRSARETFFPASAQIRTWHW